jgi:hypothetical protein
MIESSGLELQDKADEDPTFTRISGILMGDESWVYGHDTETKHHQEQKCVAGPEFNKENCNFFYVKGIIHREFVPPNTTVNSDFYCDILRPLRENERRKNRNIGATTTGSFITTMRTPTRP